MLTRVGALQRLPKGCKERKSDATTTQADQAALAWAGVGDQFQGSSSSTRLIG